MSLKDKLKKNQLTIGSWVMMQDPIAIDVMSLAEFEWLVVDMEHTSIDLSQVENLVRTIQANNIKALVRVSKNEEVVIKRVLDLGADGIIVPMVCSKNDALRALSYAKYPPEGKRGVGLYRGSKYGTKFEDYKKWVNDELVIIVQIEHIDAVNNIDEILSVNGIDGILIGPYDLSGSLGFPGDYKSHNVKDAIKKIIEKCKEYKIPSGFHVVDTNPEELMLKIEQGCKFLAYGIDYLFLRDSTKDGMNKIKKILNK